jgi:hypothetical protein
VAVFFVARSRSMHAIEMIPLRTSHPDPLAELRRAGVIARLVWTGDSEHDALVLIDTSPSNLARLRSWDGLWAAVEATAAGRA